MFWKLLRCSRDPCLRKSFLRYESMNVFNRKAKRKHRDRMALIDNIEVYEYLRMEMADRLADRLYDVSRQFNR